MSAHAEELEKSYSQLTSICSEERSPNHKHRIRRCKQDPHTLNLESIVAANKLARQRMEWYQVDEQTATNVTRKKTSRSVAWHAPVMQTIFLYFARMLEALKHVMYIQTSPAEASAGDAAPKTPARRVRGKP